MLTVQYDDYLQFIKWKWIIRTVCILVFMLSWLRSRKKRGRLAVLGMEEVEKVKEVEGEAGEAGALGETLQ